MSLADDTKSQGNPSPVAEAAGPAVENGQPTRADGEQEGGSEGLRRRPFGRSGELVSELALGTWGMSGDGYGPTPHDEVPLLIDRAVELGVTLFETADVYADGEMERQLGARLDHYAHRIVTKIGTVRDGDRTRKRFDAESIRVAFERSHERVARERLDVVLLHNPSVAALEAGEATGVLREKVAADELVYWGVSCGNGEVAQAAIEAGADVIELAYNIFWQSDLHRLAQQVVSTETAVLARSVLAHGLLAGHWPTSKTFPEGDHRVQRWKEAGLKCRIQQLQAIRYLVGGEVITLRAAALRFVLANGLVTSAVLGPRRVTQLNQLVHEAGGGPPYLRDEALAELPQRLLAVGIMEE